MADDTAINQLKGIHKLCKCKERKEFQSKTNGRSQGTIDVFTKQIGWAKDLFG
jgi:hypothetical protein